MRKYTVENTCRLIIINSCHELGCADRLGNVFSMECAEEDYVADSHF